MQETEPTSTRSGLRFGKFCSTKLLCVFLTVVLDAAAIPVNDGSSNVMPDVTAIDPMPEPKNSGLLFASPDRHPTFASRPLNGAQPDGYSCSLATEAFANVPGSAPSLEEAMAVVVTKPAACNMCVRGSVAVWATPEDLCLVEGNDLPGTLQSVCIAIEHGGEPQGHHFKMCMLHSHVATLRGLGHCASRGKEDLLYCAGDSPEGQCPESKCAAVANPVTGIDNDWCEGWAANQVVIESGGCYSPILDGQCECLPPFSPSPPMLPPLPPPRPPPSPPPPPSPYSPYRVSSCRAWLSDVQGLCGKPVGPCPEWPTFPPSASCDVAGCAMLDEQGKYIWSDEPYKILGLVNGKLHRTATGQLNMEDHQLTGGYGTDTSSYLCLSSGPVQVLYDCESPSFRSDCLLQSCGVHTDCPVPEGLTHGVCFQGVCQSGEVGASCGVNLDCLAGLVCHAGECKDGSPGAKCDSSHDCVYGCWEGECTGGQVGSHCDETEECQVPDGLDHAVCRNNVCQSGAGDASCGVQSDCKWRCGEDGCSDGQVGSLCDDTSDCVVPDGLAHAVCRDDVCQSGTTGASCGVDSDCVAGTICSGHTSKEPSVCIATVACKSSSDCSTPGVEQPLCIDSVCQQGGLSEPNGCDDKSNCIDAYYCVQAKCRLEPL